MSRTTEMDAAWLEDTAREMRANRYRRTGREQNRAERRELNDLTEFMGDCAHEAMVAHGNQVIIQSMRAV